MATKKAAPAKGAQSNAVVKRQANTEVSTDVALFETHAGAGLENVTARDLLVPRISILQGLSPQLIKSKPEYNPDARVGQIYDIGLGEVIGDEMMAIPISYVKQYLEWYPRNTGKGLARIHNTDDVLAHCTADERNRPILPNGNYIAETAQFFVLNMAAGGRFSFIPMASTQLKKARGWLTLATGEKLKRGDGSEFTPPLFYRCYRLSTQPESNNDGDWVGWKIERGPKLEELDDWKMLYDKLLDWNEQLSSGKAKADLTGYGGDEQSASSASNDGAM